MENPAAPPGGVGADPSGAPPAPASASEPAAEAAAVCGARRIEEARGARDRVGELLQWGQVIEDPEGPAVRRGHEVVVLDHEVVNRHDREVALQRLPARAVVE